MKSPVVSILEENKGKVFLPHEIAEKLAGKVSNMQMLRILKNEAKKDNILKLYAELKIDGRNESSNAYVYPVGCSPHNSHCFETWCEDEDCPRIEIKIRSTYGGIKVVNHKTIRNKEDNSFERFMKEGYDIDA